MARLTVWDTTILIDILRNAPTAIAYSRRLDDPPVCSELSRVEVLRGLRSAERYATGRLFETLQWVSVDEPIARRAGELGRRFRRSHAGLETPDLVIAATAIELDAALATTNVRHFPMFAGLVPPY